MIKQTLCDALGRAADPVTFFFRDDDAGWANDRLFALLDRFAACNTPIDLAVIPDATDGALAAALLSRVGRQQRLLGLHQHGFAHTNHERSGRKCEFGPGRSADEQRADVAAGLRKLQHQFGAALDPIFTPPWNRLSQAAIDSLTELGFVAVSRDATAAALNVNGLREINISVDWVKARKAGTEEIELASRVVEAIADHSCVGVMLHHAVMDDHDLDAISALLGTLAKHRNARTVPMRTLISADAVGSCTRSSAAARTISTRTARLIDGSPAMSVSSF